MKKMIAILAFLFGTLCMATEYRMEKITIPFQAKVGVYYADLLDVCHDKNKDALKVNALVCTEISNENNTQVCTKQEMQTMFAPMTYSSRICSQTNSNGSCTKWENNTFSRSLEYEVTFFDVTTSGGKSTNDALNPNLPTNIKTNYRIGSCK